MSEGTRIERRFAELRAQGRAGLITFLTAGDPDRDTALAMLRRMPAAGADLIELGVPFSDPMADGPAIQASSLRALRAGQTLSATLSMVAAFRCDDGDTPVVLMGYYNPIYVYGVELFVADAVAAGVDGVIVVDLPPEEADELLVPAAAANLDVIFLAAPTTTEQRLPRVLAGARGFLYYVSISGITGTRTANIDDVARAVERIREKTSLPIAVGFGINTPAQAQAVAQVADGVVVGSALVRTLADRLEVDGEARGDAVDAVVRLVEELATAVRGSAARGVAA